MPGGGSEGGSVRVHFVAVGPDRVILFIVLSILLTFHPQSCGMPGGSFLIPLHGSCPFGTALASSGPSRPHHSTHERLSSSDASQREPGDCNSNKVSNGGDWEVGRGGSRPSNALQ